MSRIKAKNWRGLTIFKICKFTGFFIITVEITLLITVINRSGIKITSLINWLVFTGIYTIISRCEAVIRMFRVVVTVTCVTNLTLVIIGKLFTVPRIVGDKFTIFFADSLVIILSCPISLLKS